ncbi:MAG: hypothetical protein ACOY5B_08435 [Spirochaetota bacterium]
MIKVFESESRFDAWLNATEYLITNKKELNVILSISNPLKNEPNQKLLDRAVDQYLIRNRGFTMHTIAETIFPGWLYRRYGSRGVYEIYQDLYPLIRRSPAIKWGTYAQRLSQPIEMSGVQISPLAKLIEKLKLQSRLAKGGKKQSCYEISLADPALEIPIHSNGNDSTRFMGGPCLSHLSFKLHEGTIHLSAIYRSHDYELKVLGNLLGLTRLMAFVSEETGIHVGSLVVHSTYAWIRRKQSVTDLIQELKTTRASNAIRSELVN